MRFSHAIEPETDGHGRLVLRRGRRRRRIVVLCVVATDCAGNAGGWRSYYIYSLKLEEGACRERKKVAKDIKAILLNG